MKSDTIAYVPRGLRREEAARYVGVGATVFDRMVADGRMPKPKRVDGCVVWDRVKLDAAFTDLPGDDQENIVDFLLQGRHRKA
jgi:predicted DNA-binding transcriptional regulator AlpA